MEHVSGSAVVQPSDTLQAVTGCGLTLNERMKSAFHRAVHIKVLYHTIFVCACVCVSVSGEARIPAGRRKACCLTQCLIGSHSVWPEAESWQNGKLFLPVSFSLSFSPSVFPSGFLSAGLLSVCLPACLTVRL